jgi:pyridoxamine-phosphate oxidase
MALADLRRDYSLAGLQEKDLARDPFRQFETWFQEATAAKVPEPNAMVLSTATREGRPSARTVLLKGMDGRGFMFFTNYESRKGREIEANPFATLVFPWIALERQVIIEGALTRLAREESTAYFHSRPRASQLAAWVSRQSSVVPDPLRVGERHEGRRAKARRGRGARAAVLGAGICSRPDRWSSGRGGGAGSMIACATAASRRADRGSSRRLSP